MNWVKVTDALPPDGEVVIVTVHFHDRGKKPEKRGTVVFIMKYDHEKQIWLQGCCKNSEIVFEPLWHKWFVSHWCKPVPAEYEEGL